MRKIAEVKIRFLAPEIAVVVVRATVSGDRDPDGTLRTPREYIGTQVAPKRDGRWQKVQVQNTRSGLIGLCGQLKIAGCKDGLG